MWRTAGALLLLGIAATTGCATSAAGDGPAIVAAAYPFAFVASQVAGDLAPVQDLTTPGAEPHDLELTPQQVAAISDADLLIVERGFQPAVDDALPPTSPDGSVLDVADTVTLRGTDPHVWLDPRLMITLTRAVEDRLVALLPDAAGTLHANADRLVGELSELDRAYATGLRDCAQRTFVTSHAAFGYLAARYHLRMVSIAGLDPQREPSPAQQAAVADVVRRDRVTTIFTETLASPAVAKTIADETGAQLAVLDPIEGLTDATADEDYLTLMRADLLALEQANGCR